MELNTAAPTTITFIGLGVMGRPMARRLIEAGHTVRLYRVKEESRYLVDAGGIVAESIAEAVVASKVVILMLPDTPDVVDVMTGTDGVLASLLPGTLVIDMSSISPIETRTIAKRVVDQQGFYLDAPVSGGDVGARNGTLSIMVGGSPEVFAAATPLLEILGKNITRIGDSGSGQTAKVANQIVVALTIQAVAEGLLFAEAAGVDPGIVREALMGGFAASKVLEVHGERMVTRSYDPGFRVRLHRKDLGLAMSASSALGLPLPGTALVQQFMQTLVEQGDGDRDHSALHAALERLGARD